MKITFKGNSSELLDLLEALKSQVLCVDSGKGEWGVGGDAAEMEAAKAALAQRAPKKTTEVPVFGGKFEINMGEGSIVQAEREETDK